jgi:hypothetical protein
MKFRSSKSVRLLLVVILALVGGWAAASGFFVFLLNITVGISQQQRSHLPFHFFPPLSVAPVQIYPLISFIIFGACLFAAWLLRKHKLRSTLFP